MPIVTRYLVQEGGVYNVECWRVEEGLKYHTYMWSLGRLYADLVYIVD